VDVRRAVLVSICLLLPSVAIAEAPHRVVVCYGDSITAGYGLSSDQAYPAALQRDLIRLGFHDQVVNLGTSGATSKDAVDGLRSVLALHPTVVIVEFGGNDGLRGLPLDQTQKNLEIVLDSLTSAHIRVLLAGITLPPNYGAEYIAQFNKVYRSLAFHHPVAFVPMIYKDLIRESGTIQDDGIHPTAKGSEILARTILSALKPLLSE
jgi:acyl-CoA thioesterase-1